MFSSNRGAWRPYKEVCHSGATGFPGVGIRGPGLQIGDNLRRFPAPRRRVYPLCTQDNSENVQLQSRRLTPILGSVPLRRHWIPGGLGIGKGFFNVPHLLRHGASNYNGHFWGTVTLTPIGERLAVELFLRLRSVAAGMRTPNLPLACRWLE